MIEFRKECRTFAEKWIEVHKSQFKRLGVVGDWENYYSTMSFDAEAQIVRELGKFLKEGSLYRGCLLYTSPSPRDRSLSRMPSSA